LLICFCSIAEIICGESGWSERSVGVPIESVSQPASTTAAKIAADARSERTSGRRFKTRNSPAEKAIPTPLNDNGYRLEGLTARQDPPPDSRLSMPMVNE
jgi:hypothetical protein